MLNLWLDDFDHLITDGISPFRFGNFVFLFSNFSLRKHIPSILDLCLSDPDNEDGTRAFLLFARVNIPWVEDFLENDAFYIRVSETLFQPSPDIRIVSRVATLLSHLITTFPEKSEDCCGFVFKFVEYCDESGVFDLLLKICAPDPKLSGIQHALVQSRFTGHIIDEVNREGIPLEKKAALLRLLYEASANGIMRPCIQAQEMFNALSQLVLVASECVCDELWRTISVATSESNLKEAAKLVPVAIAKVGDYYTSVRKYHIFVLEFLAKMMEFHSPSLVECREMQLQEVIVRLMVQFPDCSNLMGPLFRFIKAALYWPKFTKTMVPVFVPMMMAEGTGKVRTAASANCLVLLRKIATDQSIDAGLTAELKSVEGFTDFCKTTLVKYLEVMTNEYGGRVETKPGSGPLSPTRYSF
jgi:hypothetical protein